MTKQSGKEQLYRIKDTSNVRDVVLFVLLNITENKRQAHTCLRETLAEHKELSGQDRAFVTRVTDGTLDYLIRIDYLIGKYSRTPFMMLKPVIKGILRLSVYQLLFMDRVPDSAVCNEAVKLAKLHGMEGLSGFVNGILRSMARDKAGGAPKLSSFPDASTKYAVPKWLYKKLAQEFGAQRAEAVAAAWLCARPVTVRFHTARKTEREILELLAEDGVKAERIDMLELLREACNTSGEQAGIFQKVLDRLSPAAEKRKPKKGPAKKTEPLPLSEAEKHWPELWESLPVCYRLSETGNLAALRAFQEGLITAQDPAAALAAWASGAPKGGFLIDVCAAPGGKSLELADLLGHQVQIEARDVSEQKVRLIAENIERCGLGDCMHTRVLDALTQDEDSFSRADVLICDLPCSGLGIVGRKPDIKRNLKPYSFNELVGLQRDILTQVSPYVCPRGKLLYATCTLSPEENEETALWAAQSLGFRLLGMLRLWPGKAHDGFFMALLERKH